MFPLLFWARVRLDLSPHGLMLDDLRDDSHIPAGTEPLSLVAEGRQEGSIDLKLASTSNCPNLHVSLQHLRRVA